MDLNSWTPDDNARRYAIMAASSLGSFVFLAVWLGYSQPFWLGALAGALVGALLFYPLKWLLVRIFS